MPQTGYLQGSTLLLASCAAMSPVSSRGQIKTFAHADQALMLISSEACASL